MKPRGERAVASPRHGLGYAGSAACRVDRGWRHWSPDMTSPAPSSKPGAPSTEAPEPIWGVRMGWLVGADGAGQPLIDFEGNPAGPLVARRTVPLQPGAPPERRRPPPRGGADVREWRSPPAADRRARADRQCHADAGCAALGARQRARRGGRAVRAARGGAHGSPCGWQARHHRRGGRGGAPVRPGEHHACGATARSSSRGPTSRPTPRASTASRAAASRSN